MTGLLDYLAEKSGCMYLSDLHQNRYLQPVKLLVLHIFPTQYSISAWTDAVFYITGKRKEFKTQQQAAEFLLNYNPVEHIS